ncbi:MAG: hypothetical protein BMS9Abin26_0573 [Gammaproteobacteria bacterium]|nr:MAG: hypothetical protein BMS9Abin26_0573 [Gammaproteobacteria bacterium]
MTSSSIDPAESNDTIYLKHVTEVGETRGITASEDILNEAGVKVLKKGANINSSVFSKIASHKLIKPIDNSISIKDALCSRDIAKLAQDLAKQDGFLRDLLMRVPGSSTLFSIISQVNILPQLQTKLTIQQQSMPAHFQHAIMMTVFTLVLGIRLKLEDEDLYNLALAALFHDIGELHIEHEIFTSTKRLLPEQRSQIEVHPVIAYALLSQFPQYHPNVSIPVLEHHERLDGAGYPKGVSGDSISYSGSLLSLSSMAISMIERGLGGRIACAIKAYPKKYDSNIAREILELTRGLVLDETLKEQSSRKAFYEKLFETFYYLDSWASICRQCSDFGDAGDVGQVIDLINMRLEEVQQDLRSSGLHSMHVGMLVNDIDTNNEVLTDAEHALNEVHYQMSDIVYEVVRKWPDVYYDPANDTGQLISNWLLRIISYEDPDYVFIY